MKRWANRIAVLLVCLVGLTATALAARVIDLSGNGIPGVEIQTTASCNQTGGGPVSSTTTILSDAQGYFEWSAPFPPGIGSGCFESRNWLYVLKKDGFIFAKSKFAYRPGGILLPIIPPYNDLIETVLGTNLPTWANVSAASFVLNDQALASEMLIAGFGPNLATTMASAQTPLPIELAGRKVLVRDAAGIEHAAELLFVSPTQINYLMPSGLAEGQAVIRLVDTAGNLVRVWLAAIRPAVQGIFTANASGVGVPAAVVVRVKPGDVQAYEPVAQFDQTLRRFVPLPLDLGPENEFLVLALFGTGWRHLFAGDIQVIASNDKLTVECPIEYIGKQPTLAGLDQLNVRLPRTLIGAGSVSLQIRKKFDRQAALDASNAVTLNIK
jgi:hypothetical protein